MFRNFIFSVVIAIVTTFFITGCGKEEKQVTGSEDPQLSPKEVVMEVASCTSFSGMRDALNHYTNDAKIIYNKIHFTPSELVAMIDFFQEMAAGNLSHAVQILKNNKKIFKIAPRECDVTEEDFIFVLENADQDQQAEIKAAFNHSLEMISEYATEYATRANTKVVSEKIDGDTAIVITEDNDMDVNEKGEWLNKGIIKTTYTLKKINGQWKITSEKEVTKKSFFQKAKELESKTMKFLKKWFWFILRKIALIFLISIYVYIQCSFNKREKQFFSYKSQAEQGDSEAMYKLGYCYNYGKGVDKNHEEAAKWYKMAAENGNVRGMERIEYCYRKGHGVPADENEANKWKEKLEEIKKKKSS